MRGILKAMIYDCCLKIHHAPVVTRVFEVKSGFDGSQTAVENSDNVAV